MLSKTTKIIICIIIAIVAIIFFCFIRLVMAIFGYVGPLERKRYKIKTEEAMAEKYPGHDFDVETELVSGEYGYSFHINVTDENGIEFLVNWPDTGMYDTYHEEWNQHFYGKKIVDHQNALRDEYFSKMPYIDTYEYDTTDRFYFSGGPVKDSFFESEEEAIEASKAYKFITRVTYKDIDFNTADEEEIKRFAESMADSILMLHDETGYHDIMVGYFYYYEGDGNGSGFKNRDELVDYIIKEVNFQREYNEKNNK